jgi:hypothetical protein
MILSSAPKKGIGNSQSDEKPYDEFCKKDEKTKKQKFTQKDIDFAQKNYTTTRETASYSTEQHQR